MLIVFLIKYGSSICQNIQTLVISKHFAILTLLMILLKKLVNCPINRIEFVLMRSFFEVDIFLINILSTIVTLYYMPTEWK